MASQYTILIVDDDPDLLQMLTDGLELLGQFRVIQATNGEDGLEQFYAHRPDCMIIDIKMSGLDGYQLIRALRGDPDSAATPLILLTALAQDRNQFAGLAFGADQYLVKPVMPSELVVAVQQAMRVSEADRHRRTQTLLEQETEEDAAAPAFQARSAQESA